MHMFMYITDAAEIIDPLVDETEPIEEGGNIILRCIGVGHPPPLVQWTKLNGTLSNTTLSTRMSMLTNEGNVTRVTLDLLLTGVTREDTGIYACSASNLLSNVTRRVTLVVRCMYFTYSNESIVYCVDLNILCTRKCLINR